MNRHVKTEGFLLRTYRIGEIHKGALFLTKDKNLLQVIAHGVSKGKGRLAGLLDPYAALELQLYHNPVKESWKLEDGAVLASYDTLRGDWDRICRQNLYAEVIMKSHGAGGEELFTLYGEALELLDVIPETKFLDLDVQYLARFLQLTGFASFSELCDECGSPLSGGGALYYSRHHASYVCEGCRRQGDPPITAGARRYWGFTESRTLQEALRVGLEREGLKSLHTAFIQQLEEILGKRLNSLKEGFGLA